MHFLHNQKTQIKKFNKSRRQAARAEESWLCLRSLPVKGSCSGWLMKHKINKPDLQIGLVFGE